MSARCGQLSRGARDIGVHLARPILGDVRELVLHVLLRPLERFLLFFLAHVLAEHASIVIHKPSVLFVLVVSFGQLLDVHLVQLLLEQVLLVQEEDERR